MIIAKPRDRPTTRRRQIMTDNGKYISLYDRRVQLVADTLMQHSTLTKKTAVPLAVHVLDALDHIPENIVNRR
jgi:Family of unknown function (DUF6307)